MPSIQNITNIPAPRVNFIDERTGLMSREWYRFFLNLFTLTGGGTNPTSLEDLQLGPAFELTPDMFVVDSLSPDANSSITTLSMSVDDLGQSLETLPVDFGGTVSSVNVTLATTGTDVSFSATNSTTAPVIALSIPTASATNRGALSAADWTLFNSASSGSVTSVTGTAPVVSSGGTAPVISMAAATTSVNGYLTSTDWTTFNNKGSGTLTAVTGTAPVVSSGGNTPAISMAAATTSVDGYLTAANFTTFNNKGNGTVTSVAALTLGTAGTDLSSTVANSTTTPVITLNVPTASAANRGALSAADWTTFNNKGSGTLTAVTGTAPVVSSGGTTPAISMAAASTSVDGYLTAANFTIFNNKGSGSVTSVGQTFTGGLISVAGSPITTSGTLALTVAGTSGGIVYFSSASTWATSALLAANALVVGGGAGAAPATVTTGTGVVTALGVNVGTAGAFVVNGGALGTPSSGTVTNLTGTASININGTVGATTANTGAFTSLSYTTTLTGGTGIVNLGSGQFYKDASGNVGIGTSSPEYRLQVVGGYTGIGAFNTPTLAPSSTAGGAVFSWNRSVGNAETSITNPFNSATTSFEFLQKTGASTANVLYQMASTSHIFYTSNTEKMRIDSSGNVGIGTSSPASKLDVGTGDLRFSSTGQRVLGDMSNATIANRLAFQSSTVNGNTNVHIIPNGTSVIAGFKVESDSAITTGQVMAIDIVGGSDARISSNIRGAGTYVPLTFYTGGAERVRIDTSGNMGVGATANASAILDVQSTTKGFRLPNMTTAQKNAITSPAAGLMVFDTTLAKACVYSGAAWQTITSI
jgi:hypothetical protein